MAVSPRHVTLSMPDDLVLKARARAITEGSNLSAVVIAFLEAWLADKIKVPKPQSEPRKPKRGKT